MLNENDIYVVNDRISAENVDNSLMIVNTEQDKIFVLDEIGTKIFEQFDGKNTLGMIIDHLVIARISTSYGAAKRSISLIINLANAIMAVLLDGMQAVIESV